MLPYLLAVVLDDLPPAAPASAPPHVYLHPPANGCDSRASDADEVVVCANRNGQDHYRLRPTDDTNYREAPVRAEVKVAGGTLSLRAEALPISNAMDDVYFRDLTTRHDLRLRFTLPF